MPGPGRPSLCGIAVGLWRWWRQFTTARTHGEPDHPARIGQFSRLQPGGREPAALRARRSDAFGVSKKAFKQALGKLYRERRIAFLKPGIQLLDNSAWVPGS